MPTPDEIRRHDIGSDAFSLTAGRSRPQLACPDEIPLTLSQWRQSVLANNHQSQEVTVPTSPLEDAAISPIDVKHLENQPGSDCATAQASPTGSIEQKFPPLNSVTSLTSSSELYESQSPLSLSHEFSTTRVSSGAQSKVFMLKLDVSLVSNIFAHRVAASPVYIVLFSEAWRLFCWEAKLREPAI